MAMLPPRSKLWESLSKETESFLTHINRAQFAEQFMIAPAAEKLPDENHGSVRTGGRRTGKSWDTFDLAKQFAKMAEFTGSATEATKKMGAAMSAVAAAGTKMRGMKVDHVWIDDESVEEDLLRVDPGAADTLLRFGTEDNNMTLAKNGNVTFTTSKPQGVSFDEYDPDTAGIF